MLKDYQVLRETILNVMNNSPLDAGAIFYVFKDIMRDLESTYYAGINTELLKEQKEKDEQEQNKASESKKSD